DEHIESSEVIDYSCRKCDRRAGIAQVGSEGVCVATCGADCLDSVACLPFRTAVVDRHPQSVRSQCLGEGTTESTGTAGDERDPSTPVHEPTFGLRRSRSSSQPRGTCWEPSAAWVPTGSCSPCQSLPPLRPRSRASAASVRVATRSGS